MKPKKKNRSSRRPNASVSGDTDKAKSGSRRSFSLRKKLLFSFIATITGLLLLESVLWACGVRSVLSVEDPYVGFASYVPLFVSDAESQNLTTNSSKLRWFNQQSFTRTKAANVRRVFCVGGSTTYGRPYDDKTSFCGWLRAFLSRADDSVDWEIVNAGGISYASYRVATLVDELVRYEPDLFVVYTGHNEFLEERTYRTIRHTPTAIRQVGSVLSQTRIYAALHRIIKSPDQDLMKKDAGESVELLPTEVETRLDGGVGPDAYERDSELQTRVVDHYRFNLGRIISTARNCGAKVILVTPASNLGNCAPFKSQHDANLSSDLLKQCGELLTATREHTGSQRWSDARDSIERVLQIDDKYAEAHYLHGQILSQQGDHAAAKQAFLLARDHDVCPLRALSQMENACREVARQENVPLVDFIGFVEGKSQNGIPGERWFLDHVHPTIDGNRQLALSIMSEMTKLGLAKLKFDWNAAGVAQVSKTVEQGIDRKSHAIALKNLAKVLTWAGKNEDANKLALKAATMLDGDSESHYLAANALIEQGKFDDAVAKLTRSLEIDANNVQTLNSLGAVYHQLGQLEKAVQQYQRVIQLQPDFAPPYNNLGAVYQQLNRLDDSAVQYEQAIRLNPRYSKALNNLGVVHRKQGKLDQAEQVLRRALSINSQFAEAYYNLGLVMAMRKQSDAAIAEFKNALRANAKYAPAYHQIGIQYEGKGNLKTAVQFYKQAIQQRSPPLDAARRLAWILATADDASIRNGKIAVQLANQCANITKHSNALVLSTLAAAQAEAGDFSAAVRSETKSLEIAGKTGEKVDSAPLQNYRKRLPWRVKTR